MILRKPYAFLIKKFKRIHLVLVLIMIYIAFSSTNIFSFFRDYILNGSYLHIGSLSASYINNYMYMGSIAVIVIAIIIYILMRLKKKPTLLYLMVIALYFILIIFFVEVHNNLDILEITALNPQTTRIFRDISLILNILQYIFIAIIAIRAIGFDIKKFNFAKDIEELQIEASDNEEFELSVGVDAAKIGRRIRRQKRELKYFFIENLFVIFLISTIVFITVAVGLFLNFEVYNKVYNEKVLFKTNDIMMKINNSYYTHDNYLGVSIAPKNKAYIILSMSITNNNTIAKVISLDNFNLLIGDRVYASMTERYKSFFDLGIGYDGQKINSGKTATYILVFEVNESDAKYKKIFRYTESAYSNGSTVKSVFKKVLLKAKSLDVKEVMGTTKFSEKMWLGESAIKKGTLSISSIDMASKYVYKINDIDNIVIANNYTDTPKTLLKLETIYTVDPSIDYMDVNTAQKLIIKFGKIKYKVNNKDYEIDPVNRVSDGYTGSAVIIEVPSQIKNATNIELMLEIRNKEYTYVLKS